MKNAFGGKLNIDVRYDLKGSLHNRETHGNNSSIAKKDLNFIEDAVKLDLENYDKTFFLNTLKADTEFFMQNNIIDYSLLLGIH